MRIKFIKGVNKGQILNLTPPEAIELIRTGQAILTKDMTESDEEQADGHFTKLRPN